MGLPRDLPCAHWRAPLTGGSTCKQWTCWPAEILPLRENDWSLDTLPRWVAAGFDPGDTRRFLEVGAPAKSPPGSAAAALPAAACLRTPQQQGAGAAEPQARAQP